MRMLRFNDLVLCASIALIDKELILEIYQRTGHFGAQRRKEDVWKIICECKPCQSINPAPVVWMQGKSIKIGRD